MVTQNLARDPLTGEMMSFSQLSQLLQARRRQAIADRPYIKEGQSIVARQTKNTGPAVEGNPYSGWVEKNKGGIVDLDDPTNRDTVPAMLTPGEFVLNKEATQMYGPVIEQMNNHGLARRHMENQMNIGGKVKKIYEEGYTAPGQAYAIAKSMGYNTGGLVDFLKKHEGWRDKAYKDTGGVWTIGYGRTTNADGSAIRPDQTTTREAENTWLNDRAQEEWSAINDYADTHGYNWSDKEKEAMASFRYNGGQGMLDQLTKDGTRDMDTIRSKFPLYNKSGGQYTKGLENRRNYEMEHAGWGSVAQGDDNTTSFTAGEAPQEEVPVPTSPPPGEAAVQAPPPAAVVDVSPQAEAPDQIMAGGIPLQELAGLAMGGGGAPPPPMPPMQGGRPIQSAQEIRAMTQAPQQPMQGYNWGGFIKQLFSGPDQNAGYANYSQQDFLDEAQRMNNPGAQLQGYETVPGMSAPTSEISPIPQAYGDVRPATVPATAAHAVNRMEMMLPPGAEGVPDISTAPPAPGTDEALLQGSSDQVEKTESEVSKLRKQYLGRESAGVEGIEYDPRGNNQVPTPDWQMSPEGMSVRQPINEQPIDRTPSILQAITGSDAIPSVRQMTGQAGAPHLPPSPPSIDNNPLPDTGWGGLTQEEFLREAETANQPGAAPSIPDPREAGPSVEQLQEGMAKDTEMKLTKENAPQIRQEVQTKVEELGVEPATVEEAAAAETAGAKAKPERIEAAKTVLEENFGGLFDKKELTRAAVLFAGAMLTGASPQKALAIAGQHYMSRLDAKEAAKVKTQQQAAAAAAKRQPTIDMTQKDTFVVDGKKVNAYKMTTYGPNGEKIHSWVDARTQQPISPNAHQNFDTTPGTPEYNKRVQEESKQYSGILEEVLAQPTGLDQDGNPITGILPKSSGPQVAKWAIRNGIPPEAMGQLIQNAGNAAITDSKGGTQARSIEAYLNEQYIESQVGDPSLFQGAQADEVSGLMQDIASRAGLKGSVAQVSTPIIQASLPMWDALSPQEKERYARRAKGTGKSPFMVWMEEDLNS